MVEALRVIELWVVGTASQLWWWDIAIFLVGDSTEGTNRVIATKTELATFGL